MTRDDKVRAAGILFDSIDQVFGGCETDSEYWLGVKRLAAAYLSKLADKPGVFSQLVAFAFITHNYNDRTQFIRAFDAIFDL